MSILVRPVAVPDIDGVPVRFFRSPEPGPHLPWHALDDLYRAMKLPRGLRKRMLEHSQSFPDGDFRTVATARGPVVIGSHPMAQGLIGAAIEVHGVSPGFEGLYVKAGTEALNALTGELPPMAGLEFAIAAAQNTLRIASKGQGGG